MRCEKLSACWRKDCNSDTRGFSVARGFWYAKRPRESIKHEGVFIFVPLNHKKNAPILRTRSLLSTILVNFMRRCPPQSAKLRQTQKTPVAWIFCVLVWDKWQHRKHQRNNPCPWVGQLNCELSLRILSPIWRVWYVLAVSSESVFLLPCQVIFIPHRDEFVKLCWHKSRQGQAVGIFKTVPTAQLVASVP